MNIACVAAYIEGYDQGAKNNDPYRDVEIGPPIRYDNSVHWKVSGLGHGRTETGLVSLASIFSEPRLWMLQEFKSLQLTQLQLNY